MSDNFSLFRVPGFRVTRDMVSEASSLRLVPKPDPGDGGALGVGFLLLETEGVETRTLPDPEGAGYLLVFSLAEHEGNCTVTSASAVDAGGNDTIALTGAGQGLALIAVQQGAAMVWRVLANFGATLSDSSA